MTKSDLTMELIAAANSGTILPKKHDPAFSGIPFADDRSVLTLTVSSSLIEMLQSGSFNATQYQYNGFKNPCYVVEPTGSAFTSLPVAIGIPSGTITPSTVHDRLMFVSGSWTGWHVYGESQSVIDAKVASGSVVILGPVL